MTPNCERQVEVVPSNKWVQRPEQGMNTFLDLSTNLFNCLKIINIIKLQKQNNHIKKNEYLCLWIPFFNTHRKCLLYDYKDFRFCFSISTKKTCFCNRLNVLLTDLHVFMSIFSILHIWPFPFTSLQTSHTQLISIYNILS